MKEKPLPCSQCGKPVISHTGPGLPPFKCGIIDDELYCEKCYSKVHKEFKELK